MFAQLTRVLFVTGLALSSFSNAAFAQVIRVTLLGTGSPPPMMNRFGPSFLVGAGDKKFLFNAKGVDSTCARGWDSETFQRAGRQCGTDIIDNCSSRYS